ncbi:hypothetical protein PGTUg99_022275, partial [Puccinia graminis f. sp. tritici]
MHKILAPAPAASPSWIMCAPLHHLVPATPSVRIAHKTHCPDAAQDDHLHLGPPWPAARSGAATPSCGLRGLPAFAPSHCENYTPVPNPVRLPRWPSTRLPNPTV